MSNNIIEPDKRNYVFNALIQPEEQRPHVERREANFSPFSNKIARGKTNEFRASCRLLDSTYKDSQYTSIASNSTSLFCLLPISKYLNHEAYMLLFNEAFVLLFDVFDP